MAATDAAAVAVDGNGALAVIRQTEYIFPMNVERDIFQMSPEAEAEADRRALEDIKAGRVIPHEKVVAWLKTWGTPEEGPPPAEWRR
jgi:predicted transcriptional regulator